MRKILLTSFLLLLTTLLFAQLRFKASLIPGPANNTVDIVISPTVNFTGYLTSVIFIFQIPQGITQPTITKTSLSSYFSSFSNLPTLPNEGGYTTYGFSALNTSITSNTGINAGDNYPVIRLTFTGGPSAAANVRLSHLAGGGPGTLYQNYIEANAVGPGAGDYTNYVQMFFGSIIIPASPLPDEATGYSTYQYTEKSQVLPISWLAFDVIKKDNDALLNWTVANEESNHHYQALRSLNGSDYIAIAAINKTGSGNGLRKYSFTDTGIDNLGSSILFYRLKQTDIDGKSSLSDVRIIRMGKGDGQISIFPNPAQKGFYVNILPGYTNNNTIKLNLLNLAGQQIVTKTITTLQASNYYFDVSNLMLSAGQYHLQVVLNDKMIESKKIVIINE